MIARPDTIDGAFLLFPTLSNMADTVNGARLRVCSGMTFHYVKTFDASLFNLGSLPLAYGLYTHSALLAHIRRSRTSTHHIISPELDIPSLAGRAAMRPARVHLLPTISL
jgi:hypothetical protein